MENRVPFEIAMDFIKRINSGDVAQICEMLTEDHIFQDSLGKRILGKETMRKGWTGYFKMVGDYKIRANEFFQQDTRVAIFGSASGTYVSTAHPSATHFWEVPAAWRAVVRDGLVAEWAVYADNEPLRKLMEERAA
ncbi:MAG TPA: nuclear transport factor 2 family protein [Candidatus Acidoferrum sp.]